MPSKKDERTFNGTWELVYRCLNCGHVLQNVRELPERCPNCGAPKEEFVLVEED